MSLGKHITGKRFKRVFLALCIGTGICLLFYKERLSLPNALQMFHHVAWSNGEIGNNSKLQKCIKLAFSFQSECDNFTTDQIEIFKQFTELNDSYTLRLYQLKVVLYERKQNFIKNFPPSTDILTDNTVSSNDTKLILSWTTFFGKEHWIKASEFENCQSRCAVTTKKEDLSNSSAVIMHGRDMSGIQDLPKTRQPHQRWIYFIQESPHNVYLNLKEFNDIWNTTATYRFDSDIYAGYGGLSSYYASDQLFQEQLNNILKSKHKLIAARISNCERKSTSRIAYIRKLQKYIQVDFYGVCGDKKCPKGGNGCEADLMKQYKFILAFENSNCRDYITEKFWTPLLSWNSVPVVMGGSGLEDYLRVAPPYSFIHVGGFKSPKQLAEYLKFMNNHPDYYALLHHWRQCHGQEATGHEQSSWCAFCDLLHNISAYGQSYTDFEGWYHQDSCKRTV